jgi:c(7)-type cytochrome triheme protein
MNNKQHHPATSGLNPYILGLALSLVIAAGIFCSPDARAQYGDIVLNNYSDKSDVRPVIFPHWFHRIRYSFKACPSDIGFPFKAGGSKVNMLNIINGEYCGACHNGQIAWSVENCDLCHSAKPHTPTQVIKSNVLKAPK